MDKLTQEFIDDALKRGVVIPPFDDLPLDKWINFRADGSKDTGERFIAHRPRPDFMYVTVGSFRGLFDTYTWKSGGSKYELTPEEKAQREKDFKEQQEEEARFVGEQLQKAKAIFSESKEATEDHPYLKNKKIKPHGARISGQDLVIPIWDAGDENQTLIDIQRIQPDGTKKFFYGLSPKRGYYLFGEIGPDKEAFIGEGFATCASVYEATGKATICAFSALQLPITTDVLIRKGKLRLGHLLQDLGEAGEGAAATWKKEGFGEVFVPDWGAQAKPDGHKDFNDLSNDRGAEEVKKQLSPRFISSIPIQDFLDQTAEPPKWIVENTITEGSINFLYSSAGTGKSMMAMHLAIAISKGLPIFGKATKKGKVLFIDAELTNSQLLWRWSTAEDLWAEAIDDDNELLLSNISLIPWLNIEEKTGRKINLYQEVCRKSLDREIERHDFIIIDNLDKVTTRSMKDGWRSDEEDWNDCFRWKRIWKSRGKTFLTVAHENKQGDPRGTGKMIDDADTVLQLERMLPETLEKTPYKDRLSVYVTFKKGRSIMDKEMRPFALSLWNLNDKNRPANTSPDPWQIIPQDIVRQIVSEYKPIDITRITF